MDWTPAEQAEIDALISEVEALMRQRRARLLAEMDARENFVRAELIVIDANRQALLLGRAVSV